MDEKSKSPIELMADLLATMTARAVEAERQRDEAQKSSDEWYQHWQDKDAALKEAEAKLADEIAEHQATRQQLREALKNQEGIRRMGKAITKAKEIAAEAPWTAEKTKGGEVITKAKETATAAENEATAATVEQAPAVTLDELEGMDMSVFGQDETEAEDAPRPAWRITDDGCADWACRKIAEERAELARIRELAEAQIARIEEKLAAAERRCENGTRFLTSKLAEYFETVPHKTTKTKASYRLLSGTLTRKFGGATMEKDDSKLVEFLKASGNLEFIKTEEKPKWGEYKKRLEIMGGSVVDTETGEIVEGVKAIEKPDTFSVDV